VFERLTYLENSKSTLNALRKRSAERCLRCLLDAWYA
jgi:hypothetical protein